MEGKGLRTNFGTVFLAVLILSVVGETIVEARVCCQGPWGRACYHSCTVTPLSSIVGCVSTCGCKQVGGACPPGYQNLISPLQNYAGAINEYCKLGCTSSVYNAITTLQNSGLDAGEEIVNEAVEQCTNVCSAFGTKGRSTSAI